MNSLLLLFLLHLLFSFGELKKVKQRKAHPNPNIPFTPKWPPYAQPKNGIPRNCAEVGRRNTEGIFEIEIRKWKFPVYCLPDPEHKGPAWTIIQRRIDGSVNFNRNWKMYERGFGRISGEHWLGLRKIYELTNSVEQELWIKMTTWTEDTKYAKYGTFYIGTARQRAALNVSRYYGDAGDSLTIHDGMMFSTYDRDNDKWVDNCAAKYAGGWWFNLCHESNLNGKFRRISRWRESGIKWATFDNYTALKYAHMALRPVRYSVKWGNYGCNRTATGKPK